MARRESLDAIRGFAVLGLLFLNIYYFSIFETGYINLPKVPFSDTLIDWFNMLVLDGRFRSLFCLLFGAGICIQMEKYKREDVIKKRLFWIVVIGLFHGYLLWPIDILVTYGLAGYIAIKFIHAPPKKLIIGASSSFSFGLLMMILLGSLEIEPPIIRGTDEYYKIINDLPQSVGGHLMHNGLYYSVMLLVIPVITIWYSIGLMLAGMYCYKQGIFERGLAPRFLPLVIVLVVILSLFTALLKYLDILALTVLIDGMVWVNAFAGALLIVHVFCHLFQNGARFTWLQAVGKMALSFYIFQSVSMICFFYWVMPNGYEIYTRKEYMAVALLFSILQLLIAPLYLRLFRIGPFEYILRKLCSGN